MSTVQPAESLTPEDFGTRTWRRVTMLAIAEINGCRDALERESDAIAAAELRGEARAWRSLTGLQETAARQAAAPID